MPGCGCGIGSDSLFDLRLGSTRYKCLSEDTLDPPQNRNGSERTVDVRDQRGHGIFSMSSISSISSRGVLQVPMSSSDPSREGAEKDVDMLRQGNVPTSWTGQKTVWIRIGHEARQSLVPFKCLICKALRLAGSYSGGSSATDTKLPDAEQAAAGRPSEALKPQP